MLLDLLLVLGFVSTYGLGLFQGCWHTRKGTGHFILFWLSIVAIVFIGAFYIDTWLHTPIHPYVPNGIDDDSGLGSALIKGIVLLGVTAAIACMLLIFNLLLLVKWLCSKTVKTPHV